MVGYHNIDTIIRNLLQRLVTLNAVLNGFRSGSWIHLNSKPARTVQAAQNVAAATAEIQDDVVPLHITAELPHFNSAGDVGIMILPLEISCAERSLVMGRRSIYSDCRINILHTGAHTVSSADP